MEQPEWGPRVVRVIAGEIRRYRIERKMSAQALSDACAAIGWPIKRSVLSNLESGYRETITVPEVLVIAQALEVPPLALLLPLGHADTVEVAPGVEVSTMDALRWLRGAEPLPGTAWKGADGQDFYVVASFVLHEDVVSRYRNYRTRAELERHPKAAEPFDDGVPNLEKADQLERDADRTAEQLRNLRHLMRTRGLTPPSLPSELAYIEERS